MHDDGDDPLNMLEALGIFAIALCTAVWAWAIVCLLFWLFNK